MKIENIENETSINENELKRLELLKVPLEKEIKNQTDKIEECKL
jgi:hypothetical protein